MRALIRGGDQSLLIDNQFDLPRTRAMLDGMRPIVEASAIRYSVIIHGNGDHCYGNELLAGTEIWAAPEATMRMRAKSPALIAGITVRSTRQSRTSRLHHARRMVMTYRRLIRHGTDVPTARSSAQSWILTRLRPIGLPLTISAASICCHPAQSTTSTPLDRSTASNSSVSR